MLAERLRLATQITAHSPAYIRLSAFSPRANLADVAGFQGS